MPRGLVALGAVALLLAAAAGAAAAPRVLVEAAPGRPLAILVEPAAGSAGCALTLAGHPKAARAARGVALAQRTLGAHPPLFQATLPAARRDLHVAAVVACPDGRRETSPPARVLVAGRRGTRGRLAPKRWLRTLAGALASRAAELGGDAGTPAEKRSWADAVRADFQGDPDEDPLAAFAFDPAGFLVAAEMVHGTEVVVAQPRDTTAGPPALDVARTVIELFHAHWHVFAGFPLERFVVKLRPQVDAAPFGLSVGGLVADARDRAFPGFWEFVAHETFHAWNGGLLFPKPDGNLFQLETWLVEGATVYYAFRALGAVRGEAEFQAGMGYRLAGYRERSGGPADRPIAELVAEIGGAEPGTSGDLEVMLYARGMLLAYLLDVRLAGAGTSLDAVLRRLYRHPGLDGMPFTQALLEAAVAAEAGAVVRDEHAALLAGDADLEPLVGGGFTLLPR